MFPNEELLKDHRNIGHEDRGRILEALLNEEIDIEIALRERLKNVVESRLNLALLLHEAAAKHSNPVKDEGGTNSFAEAALAAYASTNDPLKIFFLGEHPNPPQLLEPQPQQIPQPSTIVVPESQRPRHAPRQQLHHEDRVGREPNKFLFLRDSTSTPTMVYKIACPDCGRSDFPRLQGLLNHCRLKHHREFGSHDECVQACAVVVSEDDQDAITAHGLEVTGMSASLRRLFEMAVGSYGGIVIGSADDIISDQVNHTTDASYGGHDNAHYNTTLITKTLGHHKDTTALAPFLGRGPRKREIKSVNNDEPVDILGLEQAHPKRWIMHYANRSQAPDDATGTTSDDDDIKADNQLSFSRSHIQASSRFHITSRLQIKDMSLRIMKAGKHEDHAATHKWLISVSAPSYSLHPTTVISSVTVTSATLPAPPTFLSPVTISEPPFSVMGLTDRPFLAKIKIIWADERNKPTELEHWVELDSMNHARPVLGDEQLVDIELDRHTELLPQRPDAWEIDWSANTDVKKLSLASASGSAIEQEHIKVLRSLLPRFPMTAKDAGARKNLQLPYLLPMSLKHFQSMLEGRRKAIEIGRARALWEAYKDTGIAQRAVPSTFSTSSDSCKRELSHMDVYRWMQSENLFPISPHNQTRPLNNRQDQEKEKEKQKEKTKYSFCSICGQQMANHRKNKGRAREGLDSPSTNFCIPAEWLRKMPILDVQELRAYQANMHPQDNFITISADAHADLLRVVDPRLTLSVERVVSSFRLDTFPSLLDPLQGGIGSRYYAPYALLATSVRILVKRLVSGALQVLDPRFDPGDTVGLRSGNVSNSGSHGQRQKFLVPAHVSRGLIEGARRRDGHSQRTLLLCLTRLGIAAVDTDTQQPPAAEANPTDNAGCS